MDCFNTFCTILLRDVYHFLGFITRNLEINYNYIGIKIYIVLFCCYGVLSVIWLFMLIYL